MKEVYKGTQIVVREFLKKIRGEKQVFEFVSRRDVVLCIPFDSDNNIIFVDQYRAAIDSNVLELPAGKVDHGETLEVAIKRELIEEIGYELTELEHIGSILGSPHFSDEKIHVFKAKGKIVRDPTPTKTESFSGVISMSAKEVERSIANSELIDGKSIAAITLLMAKTIQWEDE